MTDYDAPHRTETQRLGDDIATACRNLRRDWGEMLPKGGAVVAPGWATRSGASQSSKTPGVVDDFGRLRFPQDQSPDLPRRTPEDDEAPKPASDHDTRRIDKIVSLRATVTDVLNGWCRVICEDRGTTGHLPDGRDALAMATFLERHSDWMSGHEAASDCRDEVVELAKRCHLVANPPRKETMSIGPCPLEVPGEADVLEVCGGDVRVRLTGQDRDGEAYATCQRCSETAVWSWWEPRMYPDAELRAWLTDAGVVTFVHHTYGEVIKEGTVRQWVRRGVLVPSGKDDDGRRLFARDAVVYAIDLHKRRQSVSRGAW